VLSQKAGKRVSFQRCLPRSPQKPPRTSISKGYAKTKSSHAISMWLAPCMRIRCLRNTENLCQWSLMVIQSCFFK